MRAFLVIVRAEDEDLATALLWEARTLGIQVQDAREGRVPLLAYFDDDAEADAISRALSPVSEAAVQTAEVPRVDWVARFREGFRAFDAAGFHIVPEWEAPGSAPPDAATIVVDPGQAFGTGTHESTQLCLEALRALAGERVPVTVLDIGAGTGILAIAARRLGARIAFATDIDPLAMGEARRHARLNGVNLPLVCADGGRPFRAACADLVFANIAAPLLIERRDELVRLRAPGGAIVLSGLLVTDLPAVREAWAGAGRFEERRRGEWAALVVRDDSPREAERFTE